MWIHTRTETQPCAVHGTMVLGLCLWIWLHATPLAEKRQNETQNYNVAIHYMSSPEASLMPVLHLQQSGTSLPLDWQFCSGAACFCLPWGQETQIGPSALQQRRVGGQVSLVGTTPCQAGPHSPNFHLLRSPLQYTISSQILASEELELQ